jgi:hemin uptake protein HemP
MSRRKRTPPRNVPITDGTVSERSAIFISHANPEDNNFVLWLAAKLSALGYEVWADILKIRPGNDWERKLEHALRHKAQKMLLVGTASGVKKQGVRNEIHIATEVAKAIGDDSFIIPLRLEQFEAPFLVVQAQRIEFEKGWSQGLVELTEALKEYRVHKANTGTVIWNHIQQIHSTKLSRSDEKLISNWLSFNKLPSTIWFHDYPPLSEGMLASGSTVPHARFKTGFIAFANKPEQHLALPSPSRSLKCPTTQFLKEGWSSIGLDWYAASNIFSDLTNQAIERDLVLKNLQRHLLSSKRSAWWGGIDHLPKERLGFKWKDVKGSRQIQGYSDKRAMYWHLAPSFSVRVVPRPHVRVKSHLLFGPDGTSLLDDNDKMHTLRR